MLGLLATDVNTFHAPNVVMKIGSNNLFWVIMQHQTDFYYEVDGKARNANAGDILITPPYVYTPHGARSGSKKPWVDDWIIFDGEDIAPLLNELRLPINTAFDVANSKFLSPYILRIKEEHNRCKMGYEQAISNIIFEMLIDLGRRYDKQRNIILPQKRVLERVRNEMLSNYSKEWDIKMLSEISGYSQSHFCFLYQKFYNSSPIDDLLKHRIHIAKSELLKKQLSVTEISAKCGFNSLHHFSRYFKKYVGISPSSYSESTITSQIT